MRKKTFGLGIFVILVGVMTLVATFYFSPEQKLQRLGYAAEEARSFSRELNQEALDALISREYSASYVELLSAENFVATNFLKYLAALDKSQLDAAATVQLVNHPDYDESLTYSNDMLAIMLHDRYISANRNRYFDYLDSLVSVRDDEQPRSIISAGDIISIVNANRDRDYYTDTAPANVNDAKLMLANKYYYLSEDYIPDLIWLGAEYGAVGIEVEQETRDNFIAMFDAALESGFRLYVTSGYRGYAEQAEVYNSWVSAVGEVEALNYAALPGYSEHQTGLVLDIFVMGETTNTFANHPAAQWLAENSWKYGFILRYAEEFENLTGYEYEAWHFRYVGHQAATEIFQNNLTLEEYWALKNL